MSVTAAAIMAVGALAGGVISAKGQSSMAGYYEQAAEQMRRQRSFLAAQRESEERAFLAQAEAARFNAEQYSLQGRLSLLAGEYNQKRAALEEMQVRRRAEALATRISSQGTKLMGGQVVAHLSSGLALEGTPALVLAETDRKIKEDIANALEAGDLAALDASERGAMASLAGLSGAARASAGAADSWGRASAALSGAQGSRLMLAHDLWMNDMQAWSLRNRAAMARLGAWGSLFSGFTRAGATLWSAWGK